MSTSGRSGVVPLLLLVIAPFDMDRDINGLYRSVLPGETLAIRNFVSSSNHALRMALGSSRHKHVTQFGRYDAFISSHADGPYGDFLELIGFW